METNWIIFQIADSAFPTGGFALSSGLEAASKMGEVEDELSFKIYLRGAILQAGHGGLPIVNAAYDRPQRFEEWNSLCHAFLNNHMANKASRMQGHSFLMACDRTFGKDDISKFHKSIKELEPGIHYAPVYGSIMQMLEIPRAEAQKLFLYLTFRDVLSAAVRLGLLGPYQAQQIHCKEVDNLDGVLEECGSLNENDLAQMAPLVDIYEGAQDTLDNKLLRS